MSKRMAFKETKALLKGYWSNPKIIIAMISASSVIFGYWSLIEFLKNFSFFTDFLSNPLVKILQMIPLAFMIGANFLGDNSHLVALKKDWMDLSIKTHIIIASFIVLGVALLHFFHIGDKDTEKMNPDYLA